MLKLIDVSFYTNDKFADIQSIIQFQRPAYGYIDFLKNRVIASIVKHFTANGKEMVDGVPYTFFKGHNSFFNVPIETLRHIKKERPDIVIVQGLGFPIQVIALRLWLGKKIKIIAQHHAERPMPWPKKLFQKIADRCINAYLFTAKENAEEWFDQKIIRRRAKYNELLELSTSFTRLNKQEARRNTGIAGGDIFLWVGRLEANKDPLTVLNGFALYLNVNPDAKLYMAYQEDDLLGEVKAVIDKNLLLQTRVYLLGKIKHSDLAAWLSAADYFISGSHREGSGTALIEAMACGCIPIVTCIPSFKKITRERKYGYLYAPGDVQSLFETLKALPATGREKFSEEIEQFYFKHLSCQAIADDLFEICIRLVK